MKELKFIIIFLFACLIFTVLTTCRFEIKSVLATKTNESTKIEIEIVSGVFFCTSSIIEIETSKPCSLKLKRDSKELLEVKEFDLKEFEVKNKGKSISI